MSKAASEDLERIAKRIARAGLCSRREAERLIAERRVRLDGQILESPAVRVPAQGSITVDGKPLPKVQAPRLWRYHKPRGLITTTHDPQGRATVFDRLPPELPRVLTVGRLDLNSEGLLLLTNVGDLKRRLELPANGWTRRYRARVHGRVDPDRLAGLSAGPRVAGTDYGPIHAVVERQTTSNAWLVVALKEGRNREVRRVLEHLGLTVNRLIRVAFGPFQLGRMGPGEVEEVPAKVLREQLGDTRSKETKIGTAKAKPKPPRPGSGARKSGKAKSRHAHRRRSS